jgi:riboflavin synthase alpha subunit
MFTGLVEDTGGRGGGRPWRPGAVWRTGARTHLRDLAVGDRVHLEADILAKHVEKLVKP